jgi:hypothetical protein
MSAVEAESRVLTNAATTQKVRKQNPPPTTRPLISKPPVYRRKFKLPEGGGKGLAEFHEDKLVLRRVRGRRRVSYSFTQLWGVWTGNLL